MRAISNRFVPAVVVGGMALTSAAHGAMPATQPSNQQAMQQRINALETRIAALQSREDRTQADVAAAVKTVIADADRHSQLMSSGVEGSGYDPDRGFVISSSDGNFTMHPGLLMQFRNETTYRESIPAGGGGETGATGHDTANGFEISRMRFTLDGNLYSPLLTYYFQFQADQGASLGLLDAYVTYRVSNQSPLALKVGQFKDPLWHEKNILPGKQLAVDRSLADALVGGGETQRVQGAEIVFDQDRFRAVGAIHDGFNSGNTKFFDAGGLGTVIGAGGGVTPTNFGLTGRGEYVVIGDRTPEFNPFSEYDQFTALGDKHDVLIVGGGADYSESGANRILFHTVDAQYDTASGWGLYGAYLGAYRDLKSNKGIPAGHFYDYGVVLQAGYMLTPNIEPFVRYDFTHLAGGAALGIMKDNLHEFTVGANYYLYGHNAKFTVDASWLPNGCPTDVDNLGILKDDGHNEFMLRAQFQLQI